MPIYHEISLCYTLKCNASCAHCCVDGSPFRKRKLSLSSALEMIPLAANAGVRFIAFTGGEITMHRDEILKALECCKTFGIKSIIVTNAHWAKNTQSALNFARDLSERAVIEVQISADMFHSPFIPFDRVLKAIDAVRSTGMKPIAMLARMRGDDETQRMCDILNKLAVEVVQQPVVPFSKRPQKIPKSLLFSSALKNMRHIGCVSVLSPTVGPDNRLYACCASDFETLRDSALCLGDMRQKKLDAVLLAQKNDVLLDSLYLWGPKFLYDIASNSNHNVIMDFPANYFGYCHLCYEIMKRPLIVGILRDVLDTPEYKKKIAIAKIVQFEKLRRAPRLTKTWYESIIANESAQNT